MARFIAGIVDDWLRTAQPERPREYVDGELAAVQIGCVFRPLLAFPFLCVLAANAAAVTEAEIDAGARIAGRVGIARRIAADKFEGRNNDTPGSTAAQAFLLRRLKKIGEGPVAGQSGDDAYRQPFVEEGRRGTNLFAVIRGSELPDEYVMIGGHYDHFSGPCPRGGPGDGICNGATDNGAGTAVVVAIGRALSRLPTPPRRSVLLVLWDAEEDGLLGSQYYIRNPVVPLPSTVAYLNFDVQGGVLLPSLRHKSFAVGAETGGSILESMVDAAVAAERLDTRRLSYIFGQGRSDYANLVTAEVPTVFFGDSTGPCYHTAGDDISLIDFPKLREQSQIGFRLTVALAETTAPPSFVPLNPTRTTFEDARVIDTVFRAGLSDLPLFSAGDQAVVANLQAEIAAVVQDGPAEFDANDIATVLLGTLEGINAILRLECKRY